MNDEEILRAIKVIVDECVDYGCKCLCANLDGKITHEEFARVTRIRYRDTLNELDILLNPLPFPGSEPGDAVVRRKLV